VRLLRLLRHSRARTEKQTVAVVQSGIDSGECSGEARVYARLFQTYELMFWNTIAEEAE
jgi:hypothetical protein